MNYLIALAPEAILTGMACLLFVLSAAPSLAVRRLAAWITLASLIAAAVVLVSRPVDFAVAGTESVLTLSGFGAYVKLLTVGIGAILLLLQWPADQQATGNSSLHFGKEGPEYYGLMLLSLAGVMLVSCANDIILFFLAIELASIPTYVMLSISRPIAAAQEAAVKYFFLGAFSAALTLFGLSFLFGATGSVSFGGVARFVTASASDATSSGWLLLGALMVLLGLAFKLAAFPLHFYAPDVYTGAATPVTAFLSFVPKTAGIVAVIRVLHTMSGGGIEASPQALPHAMSVLLWVMAVLTMTVGNVLGLMQNNIKRMMACSSIAHSGYMLAGIYVAFEAVQVGPREQAITGVLFYLAAYGITNAGIFAVLMMLPAKPDPFVNDGKIAPATTAETFAEIAGAGRTNVALGLVMTTCALSLIGIPLTVGFMGKLFLLRPALGTGAIWLSIIMVLNAAVSAGYYLRLLSSMFLKEPRTDLASAPASDACGVVCMRTIPLVLAGALSAGGTLLFGTFIPATMQLRVMTMQATDIAPRALAPQSPAAQATPVPGPAAVAGK